MLWGVVGCCAVDGPEVTHTNDRARGSALSYPQRGALVYGAVLAPLADQLLAQSKLIFLSFIRKFYLKYP